MRSPPYPCSYLQLQLGLKEHSHQLHFFQGLPSGPQRRPHGERLWSQQVCQRGLPQRQPRSEVGRADKAREQLSKRGGTAKPAKGGDDVGSGMERGGGDRLANTQYDTCLRFGVTRPKESCVCSSPVGGQRGQAKGLTVPWGKVFDFTIPRVRDSGVIDPGYDISFGGVNQSCIPQ